MLSLISLRLLGRRRELGLTQEEVAFKAKLSLRNYQRLESGRHTPKLDSLFKVCMTLKIEIEELIKRDSIERGIFQYRIDCLTRLENTFLKDICIFNEEDIKSFYEAIELREKAHFDQGLSSLSNHILNSDSINIATREKNYFCNSTQKALGYEKNFTLTDDFMGSSQIADNIWNDILRSNQHLLNIETTIHTEKSQKDIQALFYVEDFSADNPRGFWICRDMTQYKSLIKKLSKC